VTRTANERQREVRRARREQGWRPYEVWLSPDDQARVDRLRHFSESLSEFVSRALRSLEDRASAELRAPPREVTSNASRTVPSPPRGRVDQGWREELAARARALYAEGRSLGDIARTFNSESIPTLSGSGVWRHKSIRGLLGE
jgi:hypothetical protein